MMAVRYFMVLGIQGLAALFTGAESDLLQGVEVPSFAFAGGRVNVSCMYDLRATGLYSLKWYHNDTEFYRYVPTEKQQPVDIKRNMKFQAHEQLRTDTQVTLSITSMTSAASGEYKCEVIAEHPSFRTETDSSFMTVLDEPLSSPMILGGRDLYETTDVVHLRCQPENFPASGPTPTITWYLQGRPARREYVSTYRDDPYSEPTGMTLHVSARELSTYGTNVEVACVLKLGSIEMRSSKTVRVRVRQNSYFSTYFSSDGVTTRPACALLMTLSLLHLHLLFLVRRNA